MCDTSFNEEIKKEVKTHLERTQMHIYHTRPWGRETISQLPPQDLFTD